MKKQNMLIFLGKLAEAILWIESLKIKSFLIWKKPENIFILSASRLCPSWWTFPENCVPKFYKSGFKPVFQACPSSCLWRNMPFMVNGNISSVKFHAFNSKLESRGVGGTVCRNDGRSYSERNGNRWDCTDFVICVFFHFSHENQGFL